MFTGIIKEMGTVKKVEKRLGSMRLFVMCRNRGGPGSSVAVNGVCLTVAECYMLHATCYMFQVMPGTLKVTTLGSLETGDLVNLEPALKYGDELGGHLVLGHVDGVGKITARKKLGNSVVLTIFHSRELGKYIVYKGSIAVEGVSLTIMEHGARSFMFHVSLTPYTLKHTTLGNKKVGGRVNLEVDVLARYSN